MPATRKPRRSAGLERAHRVGAARRHDHSLSFWHLAAIGYDNPKAVRQSWFAAVLATADVRDAWFGLATAQYLMRDFPAAQAALAQTLSRHMIWPEIAGLAGQVARCDRIVRVGALTLPWRRARSFSIRLALKETTGRLRYRLMACRSRKARTQLVLAGNWPRAGTRKSVTVVQR